VDDELLLLVIPRDAVVGDHPGLIDLPQGFAYVITSDEATRDCVARRSVDDYDDLDTGQGSYFITAMLSCLGLRVRPGTTLALLRTAAYGQAAIVFHQAAEDEPVPPDAAGTAVVPDWPGAAWTDPLLISDRPDEARSTDGPISTALRAIGVRRGDHPDEIAASGLGPQVSPYLDI
jgi:hypothetical protein